MLKPGRLAPRIQPRSSIVPRLTEAVYWHELLAQIRLIKRRIGFLIELLSLLDGEGQYLDRMVRETSGTLTRVSSRPTPGPFESWGRFGFL